jgi:hypothetical protein
VTKHEELLAEIKKLHDELNRIKKQKPIVEHHHHESPAPHPVDPWYNWANR